MPHPSSHVPAVAPSTSDARETWRVAGLIMLTLAVGYWPIWSAGFVWDDAQILTENPFVHASDGLFQFWFTTHTQDYWPVVSTSFWLEWRLWGMHAAGYHATNLLLHAAACWLVWAILRRLRVPGAAVAAVLFAIHPVNVESVAWITQRKNTLSLLFFLLSIWWYLRAEENDDAASSRLLPRGAGRWYGLSLWAFLLAMLSKGSVAMLPALLLGLIWWRRPLAWRDGLRLAPFFVVATVLIKVNIWFQTHGSAAVVIRTEGWLERCLGAGAVVWFYLSKALLPVNLMFVYPQWNIASGDLRWWLPDAALALVLVVLAWQRHGWARPIFLALGFFCVALVPVMGFTDVYFMKYSLVADHYQQIALLAAVAAVAVAWDWWHRQAPTPARLALAVVLVALTAFTWRQAQTYHDAETLYRDTLAHNPDSWLVHNNLGVLLNDRDRAEAISHYEAALRVRPDYADAHLNLAAALAASGRPVEALAHNEAAVRLRPEWVEARLDLAGALRRAGRTADAFEQLKQAVALAPNYVPAHYNYANALLEAQRFPEAIEQYRVAIKLRPDFAEAFTNLGNALLQSGRATEAVDAYREALRLKPDLAVARANLEVAQRAAAERKP